MTARIVHAIENPNVDCIGHLSGRKIEQRTPYEFDFDAIVEAALRTKTMLEINSNPDRRDINELYARDAAAAGIPLVINCDAHRIGGFEVARYGVATARRAWLSPSQIANTQGWEEMADLLPPAHHQIS
jgi:DNA polymerase (family 10)